LTPLVGVVGKANVGKSTFFSAATLKTVDIANYPFTTTKANRGVAHLTAPCVCLELGVKDEPVNSTCIDGTRFIPVELIDCPGLIKDAHKGKGLGNQFLDEVRKADALVVVCDAAGATDDNGQACKPGTHDPIEDVRIFETEFDLWLLGLVSDDWARISRTSEARKTDVADSIAEKLSGLGIGPAQISEAIETSGLDPFKPTAWSPHDLSTFNTNMRRISKPLIIAANKADLDAAETNIERLKEAGYQAIPTSAEAELTLRRAARSGVIGYRPGDSDFAVLTPGALTQGQRRGLEMIREQVLMRFGSTGIQQTLNSAFYSLLRMIRIYPVEDAERFSDHNGRVLPDVHLVKAGTTARQFAGLIHADLMESFIYAVDARTKRRLGESHVIQDNDVIQIVAAKARR